MRVLELNLDISHPKHQFPVACIILPCAVCLLFAGTASSIENFSETDPIYRVLDSHDGEF
jgi:hypothetical protein